jgi:apolipoprotein N-acyltransferase
LFFRAKLRRNGLQKSPHDTGRFSKNITIMHLILKELGLGFQGNSDIERPMGESKTLTWPMALLYAALAIASFHLAYAAQLDVFIILFLFSIVGLTGLASTRQAFYFGLVIGFAIYAPHLLFFWGIFKWPAVALWFVIAFWLGLFLALSRFVRFRFGALGLVLIPFLWMGVEYFRSELYYLKFSWLNVGYAFSFSKLLPYIAGLGVYGIGFCLMLLVVALHSWRRVRPFAVCLGILAIVSLSQLLLPSNKVKGSAMRVVGVQMEFPSAAEVPRALDRALAASPHADAFLLCEYTFHSPVPNYVTKWCALHKKFLIVGGADPVPSSTLNASQRFYDTAYVIGTNGEVAFKQAKCVPVQFFDDGLPAREQKLWNSPWGKIGLGVCYDCSYRRVTDELVRQGAQALIFPTLDATDWGVYQHRLHSRVGPMRAAEFGIGVVRIAGSGISQIVGRDGSVVASAGFPGEGEMIIGTIGLSVPGRLPLDHWLAPICSAITALVLLYLVIESALTRKTKTAQQQQQASLRVPVAKL